MESHAAAWGDETDKRRALSGNDDLEKSCANRLSSNLLESTFWRHGVSLIASNVTVSSLETSSLN